MSKNNTIELSFKKKNSLILILIFLWPVKISLSFSILDNFLFLLSKSRNYKAMEKKVWKTENNNI
jgi:hypothetical protein